MADLICRGCGAVMAPRTYRGGQPKKYCSGACRQRALRRDKPAMMAAIAARQLAKDVARRADLRSPCVHCCGVRKSSKGEYCTRPECVAESHRSRTRAGYWADPAGARKRASLHRATRTPDQVAADSQTRRRWRKRVGFTPSMQDGGARRRARKAAVLAETFDRREVFDRDGWVCGICHTAINPDLRHPNPMSVSLDHIVPLALGGPHTRANTRPAHLICNIRRSTAKAEDLQLVLI